MILLLGEEPKSIVPPILIRFGLSLVALLVGALFGSLATWMYSVEHAFHLQQVYGAAYHYLPIQEIRGSFFSCVTLALIGWLPLSPVLTLRSIALIFSSASFFQALLYGGLTGLAAMSLFLVSLQLTEAAGSDFLWILAALVGMAAGPAYRHLLRAYHP